MKKHIPYNSLFWGLGAIAIGLLLIFNPDDVVRIAIRLIGLLSIVIGAIQLIVTLFQNRKTEYKHFPIESVIAIIFGILLLSKPQFWSDFVIIVFGVVMIFLAINQISTYVTINKGGIRVSWIYYIFPVLLIAAGALTIIEPQFITSSIVIFVAIWIMLYGLIELISYFTLRNQK